MEQSLMTGVVNRVHGYKIGIMDHQSNEIDLAIKTPDGQELTATLHVGDQIPSMDGWSVKHILKPRPKSKSDDVPGAGSGWVAVMIACP